MKIHKVISDALIQSLQVFLFPEESGLARAPYADKLIERELKLRRKWGARDRRFFAESFYEIVRRSSLFWYLLGLKEKRENVGKLFALAVYLLSLQKKSSELFLKNILQQKAPEDTWKLWLEEFHIDLIGVRERARRLYEDQFKGTERSVSGFAVLESYPEWLIEVFIKNFGVAQAFLYLEELNHPAAVFLRPNLLKTDLKSLLAILSSGPNPDTGKGSGKEVRGTSQKFVSKNGGVSGESLSVKEARGPRDVCCLVLESRKNVFAHASYKDGLFEVQDISSQAVAPFLQVAPGQRVIDACAGAGGKALHLAGLMHNQGRILALDIHAYKLDELKLRARRNAVSIIETRCIDSNKVIKRLKESADRLLLDVPCSGLGVLRRNPDTKYKLSLDRLEELKKIQREILGQYQVMLKPGGKLVYATCSVLKEENEEQVQWFLAQHKNFELEEVLRINIGEEHGGDGFFMARMVKTKSS